MYKVGKQTRESRKRRITQPASSPNAGIVGKEDDVGFVLCTSVRILLSVVASTSRYPAQPKTRERYPGVKRV